MTGGLPAVGPPRRFDAPRFEGPPGTAGPLLRAARWGRRPVVSVTILLPGAGSASDPEGREGLADLVADLFGSGTRRRSATAWAEAIDDRAASVDASAGFDAAVARLSALPDELDEALALLAEALLEPSFPPEEIERSRGRIVESLAEQRSEPDFLARERLLSELYPGHPYGRLAPHEESVEALTREDVVSFHRLGWRLDGAIVTLCGPRDPSELVEAAGRALRAAPSPADPRAVLAPAPPGPAALEVHVVDRPGSVQTSLLFGRPAVRRSDPRFVAATVANQSLGGDAASRLFTVLREERRLTYGAFSGLVARLVAGHFVASVDCRTEVTGEAARALLDELSRFAAEGPTDDEQARAKSYLRGTFALAHETPGALVAEEATRVLFGLGEDDTATWRERVESVTREEARETAAALFAPDRGVLSAVGEAAAIVPALEALGPVTVWTAAGERVRG